MSRLSVLPQEMSAEDPAAPVDRAARRAAILHDLRTRLSPVCSDWPPELFTSMIERLADVTLRYDGISSVSTYDRRTTDRLLADLKDALARSEEERHGQTTRNE